jgi:hypothetical protein
MLRPLLTISALLIAAAPAAASTYSATLTTPTNERIIARDIVWNCGSGTCQGATDESRPAVICQSLARHSGKVAGFLADGRAFTPAELDKCNAAAKSDSGKALAAQ